MRRRSAASCNGEDGLDQQLLLFQGYHNFVWPHASLRQVLTEAVPIHGHGSAKVWQPCTPVMVAGLTKHGWTLNEVLMLRVPPWPQPHTVSRVGGDDDCEARRVLPISQQGCKRPQKPDARAEDRLIPSIQTVGERSRHIIRQGKVHALYPPYCSVTGISTRRNGGRSGNAFWRSGTATL